jgi:hypothetical protein
VLSTLGAAGERPCCGEGAWCCVVGTLGGCADGVTATLGGSVPWCMWVNLVGWVCECIKSRGVHVGVARGDALGESLGVAVGLCSTFWLKLLVALADKIGCVGRQRWQWWLLVLMLVV